MEAKHIIFDSVDEMLSPASLGHLLEEPAPPIEYFPFESTNGFSANQLYHVKAGQSPLVMKRMRPEKDWLAIGSGDRRCRAVRVWQYGLLDRLQPHINHATIAACRDGDTHAILMHDVSRGLFHNGRQATPQMLRTMLDGLATMHAQFWQDESLTSPELGLCTVRERMAIYGTEKLHLYGPTPRIVEILSQGFEILLEVVEPDVADALKSLLEDPQPLVDALANYPSTLVHGDYRFDNLAIMPDSGELVVFDWQNAAYVPATIDLCWFAMTGDVFHKQEECTQYYQQRLINLLGARFDPALWPAMVDLGCLVGVLTIGSFHALFSVIGNNPEHMRQSVDTFDDLVRRGLRWL